MANSVDDFGRTMGSAGTLTVGGSSSGIIDFYNDEDWFRISLEALATYKITLKGTGASNWASTWAPASLNFLEVTTTYGNLGSFDISKYGGEPVLLISAQRAGDYVLEVRSANPGAYVLSAELIDRDDYSAQFTAAAPVLAIGGQRSGSISLTSDVDTFQVQLEAGKTYTFAAEGTVGPSGQAAVPLVTIYPAGSLEPLPHVAGYPASAYAPQAGTYYVMVYDALRSTGDYVVHASAIVDDFLGGRGTAAALTPGSAIQARFEAPQDQDWFRVHVDAGISYTFVLKGASRTASMVLRDSNEELAGVYANEVDGIGQLISWTPAKAGDYYLAAVDNYGAGAYSLQMAVVKGDDYAADASTSARLPINGSITGALEALWDKDWIKVDLSAGAAYQFSLSHALLGSGKSVLLAGFELVNANGDLVQAALTGGDGSGTVLVYQPKTSGSYYLAVHGDHKVAQASYSVSSSVSLTDRIDDSIATSAAIRPGQALVGVIDFASDRDWYKFEVKGGVTYMVTVSGRDHEGGTLAGAYVELFNDKGARAYGASPIYGESGLTFRFAGDGTYFLSVSGSDRSTGSYTLKAGDTTTPLPDTIGPHLVYFNPPLHLGAAGAGADLKLSFDEALQRGPGQVQLRLASGELIETFELGSTRLAIDKWDPRLLTLDPAAAWLPSTDYVLELSPGAVRDMIGNLSAATISRPFHTPDAPTLRIGGAGNDTFLPGSGADKIDGGAGIDTVIYAKPYQSYVMSRGQTPVTVLDRANGFDVDELAGIERIVFADIALAYDIKGAAGQLYRVYQAAFNRVPDHVGLGFWLSRVDSGLSLHDTAKGFIDSAEFQNLYGKAPSADVFINKLYENVLHRTADEAGLAFWNQAMHAGSTQEDVLLMFAESTENQIAVSGSIQYGVSYFPFL